MKDNVPATENRRFNVPTEYEDKNSGASNFFRGSRQSDENGPWECQIIRILPDESDDYMDIVRDSVSAQTRRGPKPMFVNNYFVGDNNWRTVPRNDPELIQHFDKSRSQSSTGVQTAVSFLGEEDKSSNILQTGLSRVKSISNREVDGNIQSPVVVEPMKSGNSTGYSTHSLNIPQTQQNTPTMQQCKGLPDITMPPPLITVPSTQREYSDKEENTILRVIEKMTDTMDQQMKLSATRADCNMQQNTQMMDQFIRAQDQPEKSQRSVWNGLLISEMSVDSQGILLSKSLRINQD